MTGIQIAALCCTVVYIGIVLFLAHILSKKSREADSRGS